ncbi:MAG: hypothetical protein KAH10_06235 [Flavobacteriales bacterium]|nr:hypothetical protein [Flavobacteriales bacterium]
MLKNIKINLFLLAIIIVAILFLVNDFVVYAVVSLVFAMIVYILWSIFLRNKDSEIRILKKRAERSEKDISYLKSENEELRTRRLNITDIDHIVELSLIELNTSFTRTYQEEIDIDFDKFKFIGALKVQIKAKYGIDLKQMRLFFPENENVIKVANVTPKFLSFSSRRFKWEIAEMFEFKEAVFGTDYWKISTSANSISAEIMETKRQQLEEEVENSPEELQWIMDPLKKQIVSALEMILETSGRRVEIVENFDDKYYTLEQLGEHN